MIVLQFQQSGGAFAAAPILGYESSRWTFWAVWTMDFRRKQSDQLVGQGNPFTLKIFGHQETN
jgi:hypothetical protein